MKLTKEEKLEIAQLVIELQRKSRKPRFAPGWSVLRNEIGNYCQRTESNVRWTTLQQKIFDAIRAVLDVNRLDEISSEQISEARRVFEFIKQEREKANEGFN